MIMLLIRVLSVGSVCLDAVPAVMLQHVYYAQQDITP